MKAGAPLDPHHFLWECEHFASQREDLAAAIKERNERIAKCRKEKLKFLAARRSYRNEWDIPLFPVGNKRLQMYPECILDYILDCSRAVNAHRDCLEDDGVIFPCLRLMAPPSTEGLGGSSPAN